MKVSELITMIDENISNIYPTSSKIAWINEIEQDIYQSIIKEIREANIDLLASTNEYDINTLGIYFEDIEEVFIGGMKYEKSSLEANEIYTYYKKDEYLAINPTPSEDINLGLKIRYRVTPTLKTADNLDVDLSIGVPYSNIYEYYIYSKMAMLNKEFAEASNWIMLYNERVDNFVEWYLRKVPNTTADYRKRNWR